MLVYQRVWTDTTLDYGVPKDIVCFGRNEWRILLFCVNLELCNQEEINRQPGCIMSGLQWWQWYQKHIVGRSSRNQHTLQSNMHYCWTPMKIDHFLGRKSWTCTDKNSQEYSTSVKALMPEFQGWHFTTCLPPVLSFLKACKLPSKCHRSTFKVPHANDFVRWTSPEQSFSERPAVLLHEKWASLLAS